MVSGGLTHVSTRGSSHTDSWSQHFIRCRIDRVSCRREVNHKVGKTGRTLNRGVGSFLFWVWPYLSTVGVLLEDRPSCVGRYRVDTGNNNGLLGLSPRPQEPLRRRTRCIWSPPLIVPCVLEFDKAWPSHLGNLCFPLKYRFYEKNGRPSGVYWITGQGAAPTIWSSLINCPPAFLRYRVPSVLYRREIRCKTLQ